MTSSPGTSRTTKLAAAGAVVTALAAGSVFAFSTSTAATVKTSAVADMVEELKTSDQTRTDMEEALAALNDRNPWATSLLDTTAGKVLDDAVRAKLQADRDNAVTLAGTTIPIWEADAEKLLAVVTAANAAYDASAPAVSANHEQWIIATTPPPPPSHPAPAAPSKPRNNGGSNAGGGSLSGGGSTGGGGPSNGGGSTGGGGPSNGGGSTGGQDWGGLVITPGNPNWDNGPGPGTVLE